jgi:hypothetical protein
MSHGIEPEVVSRKSACAMLGVTAGTLRRYERAGKLKPLKINERVTVYRRLALLAFLNAADTEAPRSKPRKQSIAVAAN